MWFRLTRLRIRAVIASAFLCVVCGVMPSVALAVAAGGTMSHCQIHDYDHVVQASLLSDSYTHGAVHAHDGGEADDIADSASVNGGSVFATNRLPEHTSIHWHGMLIPNGMDGVAGLTQPHIPAGNDLCLRIRAQNERQFHVPSALG